MVIIPQHGPEGVLFDLNDFFADVDAHYSIDAWRVRLEYGLGEGATELEERSFKTVTIPDEELRLAYRGIYQTVDGCFVGLRDGVEQCRLDAIDSSF